MDSLSSSDINHDFPQFFRVHKDGHIERYTALTLVPPTVDPATGVESKDVVISPENNVKARVFIPKINDPDQKLPLILHFHAGGFCVGSPFDTISQNFLTCVADQTNSIIVSVNYRLAPENPLPIAHDDCWAALQWISTQGPDTWITSHADLGRVFLMGESAGANLAHYTAVQAGTTGLSGLNLCGMIIVHPYFADKEPDKMIQYLYPTCTGLYDDPKLNPAVDPDLYKMGCPKVLVCVAEKDWLKPRGMAYCESLKKSVWSGDVEFVEDEGEDHCFHIFEPSNESALGLIRKFASFISQN